MYAFDMDTEKVAKRFDDIEARVSDIEERMELARQHHSIAEKWDTSFSRFIVTPLLAYLVTASYYHWIAKLDHSWWRAVGPVLTVMMFTLVMPRVRQVWVKKQTKGFPK